MTVRTVNPQMQLRLVMARLDQVESNLQNWVRYASADDPAMRDHQMRQAAMRREALFRSLVDWFRKTDPLTAFKNWVKREKPTEDEAKETLRRTGQGMWEKVQAVLATLKKHKLHKLPMALVRTFKRMGKNEREKLLAKFRQLQARKDWNGAFALIKKLVPDSGGKRAQHTTIVYMGGTDIEMVEFWRTTNPSLFVRILAFLVNMTINVLGYLFVHVLFEVAIGALLSALD